jgi:hypothetical protein
VILTQKIKSTSDSVYKKAQNTYVSVVWLKFRHTQKKKKEEKKKKEKRKRRKGTLS